MQQPGFGEFDHGFAPADERRRRRQVTATVSRPPPDSETTSEPAPESEAPVVPRAPVIPEGTGRRKTLPVKLEKSQQVITKVLVFGTKASFQLILGLTVSVHHFRELNCWDKDP